MTSVLHTRSPRRAGMPFIWYLGPLVRLLAVVDAVGLQAAGVYWVSTWPKHGGVAGAVIATVLLFWAAKRGARALFAFKEYRWFSRYLFGLAVCGLVLQVVAWTLRHSG